MHIYIDRYNWNTIYIYVYMVLLQLRYIIVESCFGWNRFRVNGTLSRRASACWHRRMCLFPDVIRRQSRKLGPDKTFERENDSTFHTFIIECVCRFAEIRTMISTREPAQWEKYCTREKRETKPRKTSPRSADDCKKYKKKDKNIGNKKTIVDDSSFWDFIDFEKTSD